MKKSLLILLVLICCTFLTVGIIAGALTTHDAIERLLSAALGGIAATVLAPCWLLFLVRSPKWPAFAFIGVVLFSAMDFNAWACQMSGTYQTHFYDHWLIVVFSVPVWALLVWRYRTQKLTEHLNFSA